MGSDGCSDAQHLGSCVDRVEVPYTDQARAKRTMNGAAKTLIKNLAVSFWDSLSASPSIAEVCQVDPAVTLISRIMATGIGRGHRRGVGSITEITMLG